MTEYGNNRVSILATLYTALQLDQINGSGHGQFSSLCGIAISPTGDIYICDNNIRNQIFSGPVCCIVLS